MWSERSNRIRRSRPARGLNEPCCVTVSAARRSIALTLRLRPRTRVRSANPIRSLRHPPPRHTRLRCWRQCRHARARPVPLERLRQDSAARIGSFAKIAPSSRGVPLPGICEPLRNLAGRRGSFPGSFPSSARRSWGSFSVALRSFQSHIRVDTPHSERGGHRKHTVALRRSAFLPVRAHMPFVPPLPPRLIFVGVTDRLLEINDLQKRSAGDADGFDFWASTPVCGPPRRRTFGR